MKRLIPLLLAIFLLTACVAKPAGPSIAPAPLTQLETDILKLAGVEPGHIFDALTPAGAQSLQVRTWQLKAGAWEPIGGELAALSGKPEQVRIALTFDVIGNGVRSAVKIGSMHSATEFTSSEQVDVKGMARGTSMLSQPQELVLEKEIPLAVQIISSQDQMAMYGVSDFGNPDKYAGHEYVYAITATFSATPPEQLD